jgi:hypothetical protein
MSGWARLVGQMPLDTPAHVQAAWQMISRPIVIRDIETELLIPAEVDATLARARDRIQMAAVEYGLGLFPQDAPQEITPPG